jgi:hypothetical protein
MKNSNATELQPSVNGRRRTTLNCLVIALSSHCAFVCCAPRVNTFKVPESACPRDRVVVSWDVTGPASLHAERGPNDWDEGPVPSVGTRTLSSSASTTFTITALSADPANGNSKGTKTLQIQQGASEPNIANATCDATTSKCVGAFIVVGSTSPVAKRISAPMMISSGVEAPTRICVTHEGLALGCVDPGGTLTLPPAGVVASGKWQLEAELPANQPAMPGPRLQINVDFGCL